MSSVATYKKSLHVIKETIGLLQGGRNHDVDELKQRLNDVWHRFEQSVINDAVDEWRKRHYACIRVKGGHFQYTLYSVSQKVAP